MTRYYLNKNAQSNGDNEVHKGTCSFLPKEENRVHLGLFNNANDAVKEAKSRGYSKANGCYYCSREAHTS